MKTLTPKIQSAIIKASVLHKWQTRKWNWGPYSIHPLSVAWILANYTDDEDIIVAWLLHDTLEDVKDYYFKDIEKEYWIDVANYVKEVSEDKDPNVKEDEKATWDVRKQKYLDHLNTTSFWWMMVCCADKIHNLDSTYFDYQKEWDKIWAKFNAPIKKQIWFYWEIYKILKDRLNNDIVKKLEESYLKLLTIAWVCDKSKNRIDVHFRKDKNKWMFYVTLINNNDRAFKEINLRSHWSTSNDDDYIQTSTITRQFWEFPIWAKIKIDESDLNELDFMISYFLEIIDYDDNSIEYSFTLPKHFFKDEVYKDWTIIESKEI